MRRAALIAVLILVAAPAWAGIVYVCGRPDGSVMVTTFADNAHAGARLLHERGALPPADQCWWADSSALPARDRPDPRDPTGSISQRHRWRASGQSVIADQTVMLPHRDAILREIRRALGPDRTAVLLAAPVGDDLLRAVRDGDWALARSLLRQAVTSAVLTLDEARAIRDVARDYEAILD